jgi:hypothetical protein
MDKFFLTLGIALAAYALRTFAAPALRWLGVLGYLVATWFVGYFLAGDAAWGGWLALSFWLWLPWVEILLRVRPLRLPVEHKLTDRTPPSRADFPYLPEMTESVEAAGFTHTGDTGWEGGPIRQFLRLFYHEASRTQATIVVHQQHSVSVGYVRLTSRSVSGLTYITYDFPICDGLTDRSNTMVQRVPHTDGDISTMLASHLSWIDLLGLTGADEIMVMDAEALPDVIAHEVQERIAHNLRSGNLAELGDGTFRYTWRGCVALWWQVLRDVVRHV